MSQHNSLNEWVVQTKKIQKSVDYICLATIDSIIQCLHLLNPSALRPHHEFFTALCEKYHKPNPIKLIKGARAKTDTPCASCRNKKTCRTILGQYVESSIVRCKQAIREINFQWMEIVDFFFERPELVDVSLIDGFIEEKISEVCAEFNKNNPLRNGIKKRFGKFWKDAEGAWHRERRKRF